MTDSELNEEVEKQLPHLLILFGFDLNLRLDGPSQRTRNVAERAGKIYLENKKKGIPTFILCTSRGHKKATTGESGFMYAILRDEFKIPEEDLGIEEKSTNTPGNAEEGLNVLTTDPRTKDGRWGKIVLIGDPQHLRRIPWTVRRTWKAMGVKIFRQGKVWYIRAKDNRGIPLVSIEAKRTRCTKDYGKWFSRNELFFFFWNSFAGPIGTIIFIWIMKYRRNQVGAEPCSFN